MHKHIYKRTLLRLNKCNIYYSNDIKWIPLGGTWGQMYTTLPLREGCFWSTLDSKHVLMSHFNIIHYNPKSKSNATYNMDEPTYTKNKILRDMGH